MFHAHLGCLETLHTRIPSRDAHHTQRQLRDLLRDVRRSNGPDLLMVNGLGSQCINYHEEWCAMFVAAGLHVDPLRQPRRRVCRPRSTTLQSARRRLLHAHRHGERRHRGARRRRASSAAHVMGLSMGGMIVQTIAIEHPDRLLSMTSVMSRTGEPEYGAVDAGGVRIAHRTAGHRPRIVRRQVTSPACACGAARDSPTRQAGAATPSAPSIVASPPGQPASVRGVGRRRPRADGCATSTTPTLVIHGDATH